MRVLNIETLCPFAEFHILARNSEIEIWKTVGSMLNYSDFSSGLPAPEPCIYAVRQPYEQGITYHYEYDFLVNLNDNINQSTSVGRSIGYKVTADVLLTNVWQNVHNPYELLLKLEIETPKLHVPTIHSSTNKLKSHSSKLDRMTDKPIYIHWKDGYIDAIYASLESPSIMNLKKGITSVFQIQLIPKNSTELDASGYCDVKYEPNHNHVKKVKKDCVHPSKERQYSHPRKIQSLSLINDNEIVYELVKNYHVIQTAQGKEKIKIYLNVWKNTSVVIYSEVNLKLKKQSQGINPVKASSLEKAIYSLSQNTGIHLIRDTLSTVPESQTCTENCKSIPNVLKEYRQNLQNENLASLKSAVAFLKLLEYFRSVSKKEITDILKNSKYKQILPQLIDILAASQTESAIQVAVNTLQFSDDNIDLSERFLLGLATASHPSHGLINDLLILSKRKFSNEKLKTSVLMTLGAITNTYSKMKKDRKDKLIDEIKNYLLLQLKHCNQDENCAIMYLHALKNAALPDTIPKLLEYTMKGGKSGTVAMAAVKAAATNRILSKDVKTGLQRIYHQLWRYHDSTARIAAAELLITGQPNKHELENLLLSLSNQDNPELSTFILAKLEEVVESNQTVRNCLNDILKNTTVNNYYNKAQKGSSTAFKRLISVGDSANLTFGVNMEMITGGMLKRSTFDIALNTYDDQLQLLTIGLFTGGLGKESSEDNEIPTEEEEETAGMDLNVFGVNVRPYTFFTGKSELMSHVWSGTASEQTPILQGNFLFMDTSQLYGLQNGLIININLKGIFSLDLSGSIRASLWNKNAHSVLQANASVLLAQAVQVDTSYAQSRVDYMMGGESLFDITTDLDFYEKPAKVCLQVQQPAFTFKQNVRKSESVPGSQHLIRTLRKKTFHIPGKTIALHRKNFISCASMLQS